MPDKFEFDTGFQSKIIRAMFQDHGFTNSIASHIKPELFDRHLHRWFCESMLGAVEKYGTPNLDAIKLDMLHGFQTGSIKQDERAEFMAFLRKMKRPITNKYVIEDGVAMFIRAQNLRSSMESAIGRLEKGDVVGAEQDIDHGRESDFRTFKGGVSYFGTLKERMAQRREKPVVGIPTGTQLDTFMKTKGLPAGRLGVVVAPPGHGKSACLISFGAFAVRMGFWPVLHVTCEIDKDETIDRYDANISASPLGALVDNEAQLYRALKKLRKQTDSNALIVEEYGSGELTVSELRSLHRRLASKGIYPKLTIVDYLGEMALDVRDEDAGDYKGLGNVTRGVKRITKEFGLTGWTAHQGTRGSILKSTVGMVDIADSIEIAKVCDFLVTISQTEEEKVKNKARLGIAKSRLGPKDVACEAKVDWLTQTVR